MLGADDFATHRWRQPRFALFTWLAAALLSVSEQPKADRHTCTIRAAVRRAGPITAITVQRAIKVQRASTGQSAITVKQAITLHRAVWCKVQGTTRGAIRCAGARARSRTTFDARHAQATL
jgi:hypothetical protein